MDQFTNTGLFIGANSLINKTGASVTYQNVKEYSSNLKEQSASDVVSDFNGDALNEVFNTTNKIDHIKEEKKVQNCSTNISPILKELPVSDVGSDFTGDALNELIKEIDQLKNESLLSSAVVIKPKEYECDICDESLVDYGIHMCITHRMLKCSFTEHKDMFFSSLYELRTHQNEFHMDDTIDCLKVKCDELFSNTYSLVKHCKRIHELDFCIYCLSFIGSKSEFDNHMQNHNISNKDILRIKSKISVLFSQVFATVTKVESSSVVTCNLCSMQFGRSIFMDHFQTIHHIKNPSLTILPLFDGKEFRFETLDFDNMDGCTVPDTDLLNNPSIVYAETFDVLDPIETVPVIENCEIAFDDCNNKKYEENIPCSQCEKHFKSPADLFTHFKQVHIQSGKVYPCNVCGMQFHIQKEKYEHEESHSNVPCLTCGKLFKNTLDVTIHSKIHGSIKAFKCLFCTKSYNHASLLITHIRKYHSRDYEKYPIQKMHSSNGAVSDMHEYYKISPQKGKEFINKQNYFCKLCEKLCKSKRSLREHISFVHCEKRSFPCTECDQKFKSEQSRKAHIERIHEKLVKVICEICNKDFYDRRDRQRHVNSVHTKIKTVPCPIPTCSKLFKLKENIQRHMVTHSSIQAFNCQYCNKSFNQSSNMWTHIKKYHSSEPLVQQKYFSFKSPNNQEMNLSDSTQEYIQ